MFIGHHHLTYCTNIHPGESWPEVDETLRRVIPTIKRAVSPNKPFGIGLRLSNRASEELLRQNRLDTFAKWLHEHHCYVFTMNGFPYGGFHQQEVKGNVHSPDWTSRERLDYTVRLFDILVRLLPEGMDGGVSTSPLSYKPWHKTERSREAVKRASAIQLASLAAYLHHLKQETGKVLHLDIEPEPDGILEDSQGVVDFFIQHLLPTGVKELKKQSGLNAEEAEACIREHIRICFDSCHFAVVYEKPADVFARFEKAGIKIGKIQISAALKLNLEENHEEKEAVMAAFSPFVESTYLHQVVARNPSTGLIHYPDLPEALQDVGKAGAQEWRTHFHVPIFLPRYGRLESTQPDILELIACLQQAKTSIHLEVETYTWDVLPGDIQLEQNESIIRELEWVKEKLAA